MTKLEDLTVINSENYSKHKLQEQYFFRGTVVTQNNEFQARLDFTIQLRFIAINDTR